MIDIGKLRTGTLHNLRSRGFSDEDIAKMTADEAFDECCTWEGLIGWGPTLRSWLSELRQASKK